MAIQRRRFSRGFTLTEVVIVVALIALITALAVPAYGRIRSMARQSREVSALRQVLLAWTSYAGDHEARVLPGYLPGLPASQANGEAIPPEAFGSGVTIAARYPWRLAPYLAWQFRTLYVGDQQAQLEKAELSADPGAALYFASLYPSFGLNSAFVGGDSERAGFLPRTLPSGQPNPLSGFYVESLARVAHPERLIAFASARTNATVDGAMTQGYFRIEAPRFTAPQWAAQYDPAVPAGCGNVAARYGAQDLVVCGFVAGNVESRPVEGLRDMRMWADGADSPDWDLVP